MLDLLNPQLQHRAPDLGRAFAEAKPFRHVAIDDFLEPRFCEQLIAEFPSFDERKALNEMGEVGRKAVVSDVSKISPAYARFDALIRSSQFLGLVSRVCGIPDLLYDREYVGGGTHENLNGQDLDVHVDFNYHPRTFLHRRLNLIVFLNREWHESWGGCLELLADPWNPDGTHVERFVPLANRAVIFETTETSWHGFDRIALPADKQHLSRKSLAVYFYTEARPQAETGVSHGTIYVPRPLPAHLKAGYTLQQSDVDTMRDLLERRNGQIRFLYERELEFSEVLSGITRSLSFRIGRAATWPLRKALGHKDGKRS